MEDYLNLSVDDLILKLKDIVNDDDTLQKFQSECIDGSAFVELTKEDLEQMKLKMGPKKKIMKLLTELGKNLESNKENQQRAESSNISSQVNENFGSTSTLNGNFPSTPNFTDIYAQPSSSGDKTRSTLSISKFSKHGTVTDTLKMKTGGADLLKALKSLDIFDDVKRKALVRIITAELVEYHQTHYPPESAKIALAKAVVSEFPKLRDNFSDDGWEHYYDKNSKNGFIECRLNTMRTNLSPSQKKYNKSSQMKRQKTTSHLSSTESDNYQFTAQEIEEKISLLKCTNPTEQNKVKIIQYMEDTRDFRLKWIASKNPTISDIFGTYPRFLDYDGELIERDFDYLYKDSADKFLTKFPTYYSPRIHQYTKVCKPVLFADAADITDEQWRALVMFSALLPVSNSVLTKRGKGKSRKRAHEEIDDHPVLSKITFPNKDLLQIIPGGTNISNYITEVKKRTVTSVQPYIIIVKGQDCETFFIEGDNWLLSINPRSTPISAFNLLYKLYYVFNLKFPDSLQGFYNFIDCYIFAMKGIKPRSVVSSLHVSLTNITIDKTSQKNINDSDDSISD